MNSAMIDRLVNSLLYEGYILYPYRASSLKNRMRFNFGVLYPRVYAEEQKGADAWTMRTECLAQADSNATVKICVRFLRIAERPGAQQWQEAKECRIDLATPTAGALLRTPIKHEFVLPAETDVSEGIERSSEAIQGVIGVSAEPACDGIIRLSVQIVNLTGINKGASRNHALARSLVSAHTVFGIKGGEFVSLLQPPPEFASVAATCRNEGSWPVLVGDAGARDCMLASPIILYDYPSVAPESPGDLFDALEIDEILTLRVLTMTDSEKEEARLIDQRARRILERAECLPPEAFSKLHGAFRGGRSQP